MYKENKDFLKQSQIDFIEKNIMGVNFPMFLQSKSVNDTDKSDSYFEHTILKRIENQRYDEAINSIHYDAIKDILDTFLKSIGEKANFYTRISINATFNNGYEHSTPHTDHNYDHKQVIIFLNDADENAETVIGDSRIKPEKYKGICFGYENHHMIFPKSGVRYVLVATYI
tara:strand:- start:59 stop:571 length:513 start_codon:yes stop_codon:yes gene_type:complete